MSAHALDSQAILEFAAEVRRDLGKQPQRELHSKYLYDDIGSALFEAITLLPEYGLTRADERLLRRHAPEIARLIGPPVTVAELGSGGGRKTRPILEALARRGCVAYYPIDVSPAALRANAAELGAMKGIRMEGIEAGYLDGLRQAAAGRGERDTLLVLFLGSTIGNFERGPARDFLRQVRRILAPGDALLLGADLVKPPQQLLAAYDDSIGVTAAFNLNLLARINRELGADFDLRNFRHEARYNDRERRIEMHLRSECEQSVRISAAGFEFTLRAGETIWTESSHKFSPQEIRAMAAEAEFACERQWTDAEWPFAESLLRAAP